MGKTLGAWRWLSWRYACVGLLLGLVGFGYHYAEPKLTLFDAARVRDNFRDMRSVFPHRSVPASPRAASLRAAVQALEGDYVYEGEQRSLTDFLTRSSTTTLLVVHRDVVVREWTSPGYSMTDQITSFSVTKSFIATLVGIAVDRGLIASLDDPIAEYVPALGSSGFADASIRQVLQMSSGIDFSERYGDTSSDAYTIFDRMFVFGRGIDALAASYPTLAPPGQHFQYASINSHGLAMLVRAVNGRPLHEVFSQQLWEPLGAEHGAYFLTDLHGTEIGFWGLSATPRDFARLGQLYLHGGELSGRRLVSAAWIRSATTPGRPDLARGRIDHEWGYGLHWWLPREGDGPRDQGDFAAIGIWGQLIYVNPAAQLVVVKTAADRDFKTHEFEAIVAFRALAARLEGATR